MSLNEQSFTTFEEIMPEKTRITSKSVVQSFLVPFMKSRIVKEVERQQAKIKYLLDEFAESQEIDSQ